jgi:putative ABC transport system substrate-binding protein
VRRRAFIATALGAASLAAAGRAGAQAVRRARMGWLSGGPGNRAGMESPLGTLKESLHALGWRIGETLELDERHAAGDTASLPRLAAELVAKRPDVIGATGGTEAKALQDATRDIPIVFMQMAWDPVAAGLVQSITRPGGNLTGFLQSPELLWGKRLDLLREVMGHPPRRLGFIGNPGNSSRAVAQRRGRGGEDRRRDQARGRWRCRRARRRFPRPCGPRRGPGAVGLPAGRAQRPDRGARRPTPIAGDL